MANTQFQLEDDAPQRYERYVVPMSARPIAELMFEHVPLHEGERVLDIACGTGIVTRVAVERFRNIASIVGIDLNAGMLDVARANTPPTDIPITWQEGDVCTMPFPDASFDVVLCSGGVQFFPDKLAALCEIRRVLVSGGRLAFAVFSAIPPYHVAMADALTRHISTEAATSCLSPYMFRDSETIRKLVEDAEFRAIDMKEIEVPIRRPSSVQSIIESMAWMPYARDVAAVSEETRQAMGEEVHAALQVYRDGDDFVYPFKLHLVQARTP